MAGDATDDPGGDEDGRLLVAARMRPEAFGDFYDRNHRRVLAYFYRRTFCPHTSADLTAETFAQAWASIRRFNPSSGTGRGWLFGIGGNLYEQWLRRGVVRETARRRLGITTPELSEDDLEQIDDGICAASARALGVSVLRALRPTSLQSSILGVASSSPLRSATSVSNPPPQHPVRKPPASSW